MPRLPAPHVGDRLKIKQRPVHFSYWPSRPVRGHHALQSTLFALDPWIIVSRFIEQNCPEPARPEAIACLEQSKDFFVTGTERSIIAARPLALYYSYMNLAKAFCLTRGTRATFDQAQHGLSEKIKQGGKELDDAYLEAHPSFRTSNSANNFAEFIIALNGKPILSKSIFKLRDIIPQILSGHRLWSQATKQRERFISFHDIQFWHNTDRNEIWLKLYIVADDLSRLSITQKAFLSEAGLDVEFRSVTCEEQFQDRQLVCFEQIQPIRFNGNHPADHLKLLIDMIKPHLWVTVSTTPPYRRYYAYMCPPNDRLSIMPQLASIYAITYYLGSITRYRPHQYDTIARGPLGPRIQDFVTGQPYQFLYLLASEIASQEVSRPSII